MPAAPETITPTLLGRIRARDDRAWQRFVDGFSPLVRGWIARGGVRPGDVDDVLQDAFVKVSKSLDGFRRDKPGDTFLGWLRVIVRQRVADYHSRKGLDPAGGTAALEYLHQQPEPIESETLPPDDQARLIRETLETLKGEFEQKTWDAFAATTLEAQRADVVAAQLAMTVGAVYVAKSRVLKRLRQELEGLVEMT